MTSTLPVRVIGILWYRQEDYIRILQIMSDAHLLPPTYTSWLQRAEQTRQQLKNQGAVTVQANIDPDTFPDWCRVRGLNIDAQARMHYANSIALESARHTH